MKQAVVIIGAVSSLALAGSRSWTTGATGAAAARHATQICPSAIRAGFDKDFTTVAANDSGDGSVTVILGNEPVSSTTFHGSDFGLTSSSPLHFGASIASGKFNGDKYRDLAIGVPGATVTPTDGPAQPGAGAVVILYGGPTGLSAADSTVITQDSAGLPGSAHTGDGFGSALAAGRFTGGAYDDLAVGAPGEVGPGDQAHAGQIDLLPGGSGGLTALGGVAVSRHSTGLPGHLRDWGAVLAAGRFGSAHRSDLVVGIPGAAVAGHRHAGRVDVLYTTPTGFRHHLNQTFTQDSAGVPGNAGSDSRFGATLAASTFAASRRDDLAVGAPDATIHGEEDAGSVDVLYAAKNGLATEGAQLFTQTLPGVGTEAGPHHPAIGAQFGSALAAAGTQPFTNGGEVPCPYWRSLVVGAPDQTVRYGRGNNGGSAIVVIRGSKTGLTVAGSRSFEDPENPGTGNTGWGSVLGTDGWYVAIWHRQRLPGLSSDNQITFLNVSGGHANFHTRPMESFSATALTL